MQSERSDITLGMLVTLQRGTTYKSVMLGMPGPVLLGLASIQRDGGFRDDSLKTYGGESADKLLMRPGDIYVSLKDVTQSGDLLGSVARVPDTVPLGRLTQDTVKLQLQETSYPPDLLYWALRTPKYRAYCREHAIGTTNLSLSREDFLAFKLPRPTDDQMNLVLLLNGLELRIKLLRETNATLEAIAQAIFKSWFVDFDHVRAKMEGREPEGMDAETAALFPDSFEDSESGEIPKGWRHSTVGQSFILTMGQSPPGDTYNTKGEGIPFYQGRTDFGFRFPEKRVYCTAPTRLAEIGDVLVSVRAPVGDVNMAIESCCLGRGVAGVRHPKGFRSFTFYALRGLRSRFDLHDAEGTVFGSINKNDFKTLPIIEPALPVLEAYNELASPLDSQIVENEERMRTLTALRDGILPRLMSGKLRVMDVEGTIL